nr:ribonuclease H-like domain-containing protein [Tanacetum cinerariifolium]
MPSDDEKVVPNLNSGKKSQSDSRHSSVPSGDATTFEDNIFFEGSLDQNLNTSTWGTQNLRRCLLNVDVSNSWPMFQLDVNNAFLYGDLVETVYMKPPEGYFPSNNKVLKYFFGIEVVDIDKGMCLNQKKYVLDLLSEYGMLACIPAKTPLMSKLSISNEAYDNDHTIDTIIDYQKLMGKLIYLTNTRPDISYVVHCLSQFMHSPLKSYLKIAFKILRYLKSCLGLGIHVIKNPDILTKGLDTLQNKFFVEKLAEGLKVSSVDSHRGSASGVARSIGKDRGYSGRQDQGQETVALEVPPPENVTTTGFAPETGLVEEIAAMGPCVIKERRKRGNDGVDANAPPKVLRKDHADSRTTQSTIGGKSLASMGLETIFQGSYRCWRSRVGEYLFYFHGRVTRKHIPAGVGRDNGFRLDTPEACQDLVDHIASPGYFLEMRYLHNDDFLSQYNINLARQVRIQAWENEIKNLEALLEAETNIKNRGGQERRACQGVRKPLLSVYKPSNDRVEKRCAEIDARLDALSIDFDEELYPHMLTAITGRRWVIGHGLRLVVMKCGESTELRHVFADVVSARIVKGMSEGLKYEVEHGKANLDLEAIEAYDLEADTKYVAAGEFERCSDRFMPKKEMSGGVSYHGVGFAYHVRSDGVPVSVPTISPQGLGILLADDATQTETSEDGASPRLLRSKSLPAMYNLDWP